MRGKSLRQRVRLLRDSNYSVYQAIEILKEDGYSELILYILLCDGEEKKPRKLYPWIVEKVTEIMLEDEEDDL